MARRRQKRYNDGCIDVMIEVVKAAEVRNDGDVRCVKCGAILSIYNKSDRCFRHRVKKEDLDSGGFFDSLCSSPSELFLSDERTWRTYGKGW